MHKSLNRVFETLKEHNINANSGTHPAGYHKAGMKSLQRHQRAPSPPLPISMSYYKKKSLFMCCKVTIPKSKTSKNFQILEDIPQTLNTNYFYYWGLSLCFFLFWVTDTNHVILGKHQKMAPLNSWDLSSTIWWTHHTRRRHRAVIAARVHAAHSVMGTDPSTTQATRWCGIL